MQNLFPLILPKKHILITQKRFWPFLLSCLPFRGPQNYIFWWFKSVFWQFFVRKTVGSRETPRDGLFTFFFLLNFISWNMVSIVEVETSRLAGSLDFRPCFSQGNWQNTDLNHQKILFWGTLKSQTRHQKMAKIVFEWSNYVF